MEIPFTFTFPLPDGETETEDYILTVRPSLSDPDFPHIESIRRKVFFRTNWSASNYEVAPGSPLFDSIVMQAEASERFLEEYSLQLSEIEKENNDD